MELRQRHIDVVKRAGGYMELLAAIAYLAWRMGWRSPEIAESPDVSPVKVRMTLSRLLSIARQLGLDCGQPHSSLGKARPRYHGQLCTRGKAGIKVRVVKKIDVVLAIELRRAGRSWKSIGSISASAATAFGLPCI